MPERPFYHPSVSTLTDLDTDFVCSFSGGKDSTSVVTWVEWLRRSGWITVDRPRLVQSDTGVEHPVLFAVSQELTALLTACGWECTVVRPPIRQRLYPSIFGRGVTPVIRSMKGMRWCTRATKVDPMENWTKSQGDKVPLMVTGMRWGESNRRDNAMKSAACQVGGECGVVGPGEGRISPIITWKDHEVVSWLRGFIEKPDRYMMADVFAVTRKLLDVYRVKEDAGGFRLGPPKVKLLRFGCFGCPAIDPASASAVVLRGKYSEAAKLIRRLYRLWDKMRDRRGDHRLVHTDDESGRTIFGPLTVAARQSFYAEFLEIQAGLGFRIVTDEEDAFIRQCWAEKVFPRGWDATGRTAPIRKNSPFVPRKNKGTKFDLDS